MRCEPCKRLREYFNNEVKLAKEQKEELISILGDEAYKLLCESALNAQRVVLIETSRCK